MVSVVSRLEEENLFRKLEEKIFREVLISFDAVAGNCDEIKAFTHKAEGFNFIFFSFSSAGFYPRETENTSQGNAITRNKHFTMSALSIDCRKLKKTTPLIAKNRKHEEQLKQSCTPFPRFVAAVCNRFCAIIGLFDYLHLLRLADVSFCSVTQTSQYTNTR